TGRARRPVPHRAPAAGLAASGPVGMTRSDVGAKADPGRPRALITGASAALGRGYARALAADGYDPFPAARGRGALEECARELTARWGISADVRGVDLATQEGIDDLADLIERIRIDVLVNNAGFGLTTALRDTGDEQLIA